MFTIRKATIADCELINKMAKEVFPATYKEILSSEQLDYMMDWMYAPENIRKQMEEEGIDRKLLDGIHTPVGMPINAETPEEIAISIVSELIHEKNSLRKTSGYKKDLMKYLTGRKKAENGMALATIIERRGSAPREIGTKMLVLADGTLIGTIGGGCMESEVQHQCLRLIHDGDRKGRIFKVDMTVSEAEEEGLVCGGTIQVFLEVL